MKCCMFMFVLNLGTETAPNSCELSRDTGRKSGEGCVLTEDKTKSTAMCQSGLGMVPKAMCWLSFQAPFAGHTLADGKAVGSGPVPTPGLLRPQGPTRGWVRAFRMATDLVIQRRETDLSPSPVSPDTTETSRGFSKPTPRSQTPGSLIQVKFVF